MLPRIQKNKIPLLGILLLLLVTFSQQALAHDFTRSYNLPGLPNVIDSSTNRVCAIDNTISNTFNPATGTSNMREFGLTKRIMLCVKESIIVAVYNFLVPFSDFFARTIAVCCTLAIALWGALVATGKRTAVVRDAFILGLKIGAVIMFTSNFAAPFFDPTNASGGLFGMLLDAMESMLGIVISYVTFSSSLNCNMPVIYPTAGYPVLQVWDTVDCALDSLVGGIFSPFTLSAGIIGFLVACLVSSAAGFFIAVLGFLLIVMLLYAIARALYVFISAYIAFALMVLISPMFIPLILFTSTKAYFEKWLKLTLGFMLQPIFIFAFLGMLVAAYDTIVYRGPGSLYYSIAGNASTQPGFTLGNWLLTSGAYTSISGSSAAMVVKNTNAGTGLNPLDKGIFGTIGERQTPGQGASPFSQDIWENDIYGYLDSSMGAKSLVKLDIPATALDFELMAVQASSSPFASIAYTWYQIFPGIDPLQFMDNYYYPYLINLFLSMIMAVVTVYIFMSMLEYLPFIGSGLSGETLSIAPLGAGKLAPPGGQMLGNIKSRLASNFTGGR